MRLEEAGITRAGDGLDAITWNILGQIYVPKSVTEHSFAWHAVFPPGTFVPPHSHTTQNEYLYILEGTLDLWLDGKEIQAVAGDTVRLPMNQPHGIFNKSGAPAKCLFWVAPTGRLFELFQALHDMPEQIPDEVVRIAAGYDVFFLPPPA